MKRASLMLSSSDGTPFGRTLRAPFALEAPEALETVERLLDALLCARREEDEAHDKHAPEQDICMCLMLFFVQGEKKAKHPTSTPRKKMVFGLLQQRQELLDRFTGCAEVTEVIEVRPATSRAASGFTHTTTQHACHLVHTNLAAIRPNARVILKNAPTEINLG